MKRLSLLTFLLLLISVLSFAQRQQKVGLVLSGGGARGLAHIGAIKALEDNNIPIDYISGTSVGAIVGALYASGYSVEDMKNLFLSEDFQRWLEGRVDERYTYYYKKKDDNPAYVSFNFDTKNKFHFQMPSSIVNPIQMDYALMRIFAGASAVANNNFDSLFVPFICIASDVTENKPSIRRKGDLGQAVRASMTFPFYFEPITIDGKLMFDGGMYDNFPSKEMHELFNPDIIIGVKISGNYPPPKEGDVVSYIQNIFTNETDYSVICDNSVLIEPDLKGFGILEFNRMKETYNIGYEATLPKIAKIREFLVDSITKEDLDIKRKQFNNRKPPLEIKNFVVNISDINQKKYLEKVLLQNTSDSNISQKLRDNYFSLCSDYNIKSVQPYIYYNHFSHSYVLNLNVKTQENLTGKVGGCFSSNPISHLYLGLDYNILNSNSWLFQTNAYFGRYYTSFMLSSRVDFPYKIPFFSEVEFNANKWSYYRLMTNFFDFSPLNYIVQRENNIQLRFGIPLSVKSNLVANIGYGVVNDDYFNEKYSTVYDTADNTNFSHFVVGLTSTYSSLDNPQFPISGIYSKMNIQYIHGLEKFTPGNTSTLSEANEQYHSWLQFSFHHKRFFDMTKYYTFGWNADAFYSFQDLFSNYNSSLLNSGVYAPTLETFTQFMPEYRANQYLATGVENIFKVSIFRIDASLRLNAYLYAPVSRIITLNNNIPTYSPDFFGKFYFIFSSALVFNTPVGPLSLIAGYHQRDNIDDNPFTISVNFGYVMFNNKNIDR